jgi:hypothetical protein
MSTLQRRTGIRRGTGGLFSPPKIKRGPTEQIGGGYCLQD